MDAGPHRMLEDLRRLVTHHEFSTSPLYRPPAPRPGHQLLLDYADSYLDVVLAGERLRHADPGSRLAQKLEEQVLRGPVLRFPASHAVATGILNDGNGTSAVSPESRAAFEAAVASAVALDDPALNATSQQRMRRLSIARLAAVRVLVQLRLDAIPTPLAGTVEAQNYRRLVEKDGIERGKQQAVPAHARPARPSAAPSPDPLLDVLHEAAYHCMLADALSERASRLPPHSTPATRLHRQADVLWAHARLVTGEHRASQVRNGAVGRVLTDRKVEERDRGLLIRSIETATAEMVDRTTRDVFGEGLIGKPEEYRRAREGLVSEARRLAAAAGDNPLPRPQSLVTSWRARIVAIEGQVLADAGAGLTNNPYLDRADKRQDVRALPQAYDRTIGLLQPVIDHRARRLETRLPAQEFPPSPPSGRLIHCIASMAGALPAERVTPKPVRLPWVGAGKRTALAPAVETGAAPTRDQGRPGHGIWAF